MRHPFPDHGLREIIFCATNSLTSTRSSVQTTTAGILTLTAFLIASTRFAPREKPSLTVIVPHNPIFNTNPKEEGSKT